VLAAVVLASQGSVVRAATLHTDTVHLLVHFGFAASAAARADAVRAVGGTLEATIPALGVTRVAAPVEPGTASAGSSSPWTSSRPQGHALPIMRR